MSNKLIELYINHIKLSIILERAEYSIAKMISKNASTGLAAACTTLALGPYMGLLPFYNYSPRFVQRGLMSKVTCGIKDTLSKSAEYIPETISNKLPTMDDSINYVSETINSSVEKVLSEDNLNIDDAIIGKLNSKLNLSGINNYLEKFGARSQQLDNYTNKDQITLRVIKTWLDAIPIESVFNEVKEAMIEYLEEKAEEGKFSEDTSLSNIVFGKPNIGDISIKNVYQNPRITSSYLAGLVTTTEETVPYKIYSKTSNFWSYCENPFQEYEFYEALLGENLFIHFHLLIWFATLEPIERVSVIFNPSYKKTLLRELKRLNFNDSLEKQQIINEFFNQNYLINLLNVPKLKPEIFFTGLRTCSQIFCE